MIIKSIILNRNRNMYIDYLKEKLLIFKCKVQKSVFYKENSIRQYICYFHMKKKHNVKTMNDTQCQSGLRFLTNGKCM